MNIVDNVKAIAKKLTSATDSITGEIAKLRASIAEKRKALGNATGAPRPVEEIIRDRIPETVAESGRIWLRDRGSSLIRGDHSLGSTKAGSVRLPWTFQEAPPWGAICAGCPDLATEILETLIRQVPYEAGPATSDRAAVIARLERDLAELEAVEEGIVDQAAEAGVAIQHRPEVVQRRNTEARRRELEEQKARDRAARETALNEAHRSRAARSRYLEQ